MRRRIGLQHGEFMRCQWDRRYFVVLIDRFFHVEAVLCVTDDFGNLRAI